MNQKVGTSGASRWRLVCGLILAIIIFLAPDNLMSTARGMFLFLPVARMNDFAPSSVVTPIAIAWLLFFPTLYIQHKNEEKNLEAHLVRWRVNRYGPLAVWLMVSMLCIPGFFFVLYMGGSCSGLFCIKERSFSLFMYCFGISQLYPYVSALALISIKHFKS